MDSLIWYTGIFRIKSGIMESSQESWNPAKIPKDSESRRRKFIVSGPSVQSLMTTYRMSLIIPVKKDYLYCVLQVVRNTYIILHTVVVGGMIKKRRLGCV